MSRLPQPGADDGTWGDILNDYLLISHDSDGTLKPGVVDANAIQDGSVGDTQVSSLSQSKITGLAASLSSKADDATVIHTAGNESIGGIKTFTSSPIVPAPTTNTQAANKAYVDGVVSSGGVTDGDKGDITVSGSGSVWTIDAGTVTGSKIATTTITDANISSSAAIAQSKIQNLTTDLAAKQPLDSDLSAIAGLIPTDDDIIQRKAGAWTNRTPAQLKTDLALTKSDVGLPNVDNTSDTNKPVSTATQTALNGKAANTVTITGATSLSGGGDLTANRSLSLVNDSATPGNSQYYGTNGTGTKGYFALPTTATPSGTAGGDLSGTYPNPTVPALANKVNTSRTITTSTGLTGGGDLSADRTLSVVDDTTTQKVEVAKGGTLQGTRKRINLIEGANVTLTTADNAGNNRVDVTIAAAGVTPATTVTSATTYGVSSAVGTSANYAREDHTHGTPPLSSTTPVSGIVGGSVGVATAPARGDHAHPITQIEPSSYSYIGWNYPLFIASGGTVLGAAGTLYLCKVPVPASTTISNVIISLANAGSALTSGQCFAALYSSAGNLLSTTADQSSTWISGGSKIMALGSAQAVSAGYVYVGFFANGTTLPGPARTLANTSYANGGLPAASSLWATCSNGTGLTTAMPATLGTLSAFNTTYWAGVS